MIVNTEIIEQQQFYFAGIAVRTTNQNGQSQKDIGGLWTHIMAGNLLQEIEEKESADTLCLYTDYETDYNGNYTAIIGCKVKSLANVPEGFTGITIPAGKYQVCSLAGKFPENVHAAWQEIWSGNAERKYTVDYDVYSAGAKSFEETEVKIYLAIK